MTFVFNVPDTLAALEAVVTDPTYVYKDQWTLCQYVVAPDPGYGESRDAEDADYAIGTPKCILGRLFARLGFDLAPFVESPTLNQLPVGSLLGSHRNVDAEVPTVLLDAMTAAQDVQDDEGTDGGALLAFKRVLENA